jgi:hypothetical protein
MSDIDDLLDRYWQLAYAKGRGNRRHDTENGDAQECRSAIDAAIQEMEMRALVAKPLYSRRQLQERIAELERALERQGDNMAFVINHVTIPDQWYEKFRRELDEDRAALDAIKEG